MAADHMPECYLVLWSLEEHLDVLWLKQKAHSLPSKPEIEGGPKSLSAGPAAIAQTRICAHE